MLFTKIYKNRLQSEYFYVRMKYSYTGELRTVFGFMKYARDKEGLERFIENNPKYFTEVSETALQVLDELTHAPELKELRNPQYQTQEGEFNMSTAIQEMILEGEQKGRKEGLHQGIEGSVVLLREAGLEDQLIVEKIMTRFGLTLADAEGYVSLEA